MWSGYNKGYFLVLEWKKKEKKLIWYIVSILSGMCYNNF